MSASIAIYVEGGGDGRGKGGAAAQFRIGMSAFLGSVKTAARSKRIHWRVVACGARKAAYDSFIDACQREPETFNVLLVDSEEPVPITVNPWAHLRNRPDDKWSQPGGGEDRQCQLMVACMEAWFLADPAALRGHYGGSFDARKLPPVERAESRTKADIFSALKKAAQNTPAGGYEKIRDGARLLEKVDSGEVRKYCPWCERLFATLEEAVGTVQRRF